MIFGSPNPCPHMYSIAHQSSKNIVCLFLKKSSKNIKGLVLYGLNEFPGNFVRLMTSSTCYVRA